MPGTKHANGKERPALDRTPKMYIGGKQARPDGNYTLAVLNKKGEVVGQVGDGNRKDIRNAVEAAHAAHTGQTRLGHAARLQPFADPVLYR